ncbi:3-hydroxyacyl-CoA dehydrogenase NAD-binding domain-containing protein [Pontibaca salina]|uniref:enoyl-CoA hydratase n=1 Tax=Pontibaca salina TaxID=2795731 RepID=A0A934LZ11_9RHOB|nr:3-hydroxyacyl-CoA dehydrogenase NAD-binding domain-containing protein [Pontibaca salina]MBI6628510.1 enoyl-CoA hydratase/isomerase family protein [Pontibaca salina]
MTDVLNHLPDPADRHPPHPDGVTTWRMGRDDENIAWLLLDCPDSGTNTISQTVLSDLDYILDGLEHDHPRALVLRSAKPAGFAAGADLTMIADMSGDDATKLLRQGHAVLDRLAALSVPTIAVVHGAALGAGFEIALACDHRIAVEGASFGFPEVQLGLHPGLGGTFRLTALINPAAAMKMMLTGKPAHDRKAKALGIADAVVPERHVASAVRLACADKLKTGMQGLRATAMRTQAARTLAVRKMRSKTEERAPRDHYPAPHALIDLWEENATDAKAMQKAEIVSFANLLKTDAAKNLIRIFFLRQNLRARAKGEDGIAHVHVIGAGAMGAEIAAWAAIRGKRVTLTDVKPEPLGMAVKRAVKICREKHLDKIEALAALDRLMPDPDGIGSAHADLVIEAVPENPELKVKIYADLAKRMKNDAILATNTSSLRLAALAGAVADPAQFAGLHFFNPVSRMKLVEVVAHERSSRKVLDRLHAFCGAIDRLPAPVRDDPGFLVNRVLMPYLMEGMLLLDEGHPKEVIDAAGLRFGMPMGPLALADQIGLDICLDVGENLKASLDKPLADVLQRLRDKVESGDTGKKAGQGFYDWSVGTPRPDTDRTIPHSMTDRLILPLCDAAMECLRNKVVADADTLDAAVIFATGFAPFRGGPLQYARKRGPDQITRILRELAAKHGDRFIPDEGWTRFA